MSEPDLSLWEAAALSGHPTATRQLAAHRVAFIELAEAAALLRSDVERVRGWADGVERRGTRFALVDLASRWNAERVRGTGQPATILLGIVERLSRTAAMTAAHALLAYTAAAWAGYPDDARVRVRTALAAWLDRSDAESLAEVAAAADGLAPRPGRYRPTIDDAHTLVARAVAAGTALPVEDVVAACTGSLWYDDHHPFSERSEVEEAMVLPMLDLVLTRACGEPTAAPRPQLPLGGRFIIREKSRSHGDVYELIESTTWWVIDKCSWRAVLRFSGDNDHGMLGSAGDGGWGPGTLSGTVNVSIDGGDAVESTTDGERRWALVPAPFKRARGFAAR